MAYRILFPTDLHKRDTDFTSIVGYTRAVDLVQQDLLDFIEAKGVTHMISTGDWYDKGYRNVNRVNNDRNYDEAFKKKLNGNFYMCIGNHFFLERDNNPEMYLIQPHPIHKPAKPMFSAEPVIKTPTKIKIGTVQISLFHFDKENKDYVCERDSDTTYHIGVYHDETVVSSGVRQKAGYFGNTSSVYQHKVFDNIDLAIVGHIHTPIGVDYMYIGQRKVPIIIPGSLAITKNSAVEIHTTVNLPMITVTDDNTVSCTLHRFSLHADMLKFYDKREAKAATNSSGELIAHIDPPKNVSLAEYLRSKGHSQRALNLVQKVNETTIDPLATLNILGMYEEGVTG